MSAVVEKRIAIVGANRSSVPFLEALGKLPELVLDSIRVGIVAVDPSSPFTGLPASFNWLVAAAVVPVEEEAPLGCRVPGGQVDESGNWTRDKPDHQK